MIKKFKNGKILIQVPERHPFYREINDEVTPGFYNVAMFFERLRIEKIGEKFYLVDFSTQHVYDFFNSSLIKNPLDYLLNELTVNETVYLYPLPTHKSKKLLKKYHEDRIV